LLKTLKKEFSNPYKAYMNFIDELTIINGTIDVSTNGNLCLKEEKVLMLHFPPKYGIHAEKLREISGEIKKYVEKLFDEQFNCCWISATIDLEEINEK